MNPTFRLSRIRAPRGTIAAILLLAAVFISFGVAVAGAAPVETVAEPHHTNDTTLAYVSALLTNRDH